MDTKAIKAEDIEEEDDDVPGTESFLCPTEDSSFFCWW